jgi:site-specific recombinase XerD
MTKLTHIQPLFHHLSQLDHMGNVMIEMHETAYNKTKKFTLINANNDAEAIAAFLNEYKESPETLRSYAKEIERLLLWCIHIGNTNISSLRRNHLLDYQAFLKNPEPKKLWCGPSTARLKKSGVINPHWRSFVKGLSGNSINKSIKILDSFFNYLVQANYLTGNPMAVDRRRKKRNHSKPKIVDRYLELDEIQTVLAALQDCPIQNETQHFQMVRARYIILLLFYTGLRIAEAANHRMGHFLQREGNWFLRVTGKGKKLREIPVPDELLMALADFRIAMKLPSPQPKFRERVPLIPMKNLKHPISPRRIDQILRWAFTLGAAIFELSDPHKASKLHSASAHWLRHSYVTYLLGSGAPLKVAQDNAGHSDIGTTMQYCHVSQIDRHAATKGLSLSTPST